MSIVNLKEILAPAYAKKYAVGAFNVINSELLEAVIGAADKVNSPVILNMAEVHLKYVDLEVMAPAIIKRAQKARVPVAINLDHGLKFETVVKAVRSGFTSVMFDGSHLSYEDNIAQTREIVRMCHAVNVSVEAELGAVGGSEGGELVGSINPDLYTDPAQAEDFVRRTQIDALAVAIGNAHGKYKGVPKLDFERLDKIRKTAGVPLVLHGGSGIPDDDFRKAITLGIAKINFFTGMAQAAIDTLKKAVLSKDVELKYNAYPDIIFQIQESASKTVIEQMKVFGSDGKA